MEINDNTPPPPTSIEDASGGFVNQTTSLADDGFGTDAFLTLFLEQLQNQDPLNPQDTTEMTAQLATLTQVEQSVRSSEALVGVNERLDTLIEATLGKTAANLDPVSMIGRSVEVGQSELTIPSFGESPRIHFEVSTDRANALVIEATDSDGDPIGAAVLANANEDGASLPFAPGSYELFFNGTTPQVRMPDGTVAGVGFGPVDVDTSGNLVLIDGPSVQLFAEQAYDFRIRATGRDSEGAPLSTELPTTTTGVVDSVRIVDGQSVLTIGNQQFDPTRIIGIR